MSTYGAAELPAELPSGSAGAGLVAGVAALEHLGVPVDWLTLTSAVTGADGLIHVAPTCADVPLGDISYIDIVDCPPWDRCVNCFEYASRGTVQWRPTYPEVYELLELTADLVAVDLSAGPRTAQQLGEWRRLSMSASSLAATITPALAPPDEVLHAVAGLASQVSDVCDRCCAKLPIQDRDSALVAQLLERSWGRLLNEWHRPAVPAKSRDPLVSTVTHRLNAVQHEPLALSSQQRWTRRLREELMSTLQRATPSAKLNATLSLPWSVLSQLCDTQPGSLFTDRDLPAGSVINEQWDQICAAYVDMIVDEVWQDVTRTVASFTGDVWEVAVSGALDRRSSPVWRAANIPEFPSRQIGYRMVFAGPSRVVNEVIGTPVAREPIPAGVPADWVVEFIASLTPRELYEQAVLAEVVATAAHVHETVSSRTS